MAWFSLVIGGLLLLYLARGEDKKQLLQLLDKDKDAYTSKETLQLENAINLSSLNKQSIKLKIRRFKRNLMTRLGDGAPYKLLVFVILLAAISLYINANFFRGNSWLVLLVTEVFGLFILTVWLRNKAQKDFEAAFPDALTMLTSAVSSGESLMHAIIYVGNTLDSEVGKEFKLMGERLQMGEAPESVFTKSARRFPYASFNFFIITMNANIQRGGQLKDVMTRLNRIMFDARAVEKKKFALTSEARISAKIVGAIPFIFLFILQYLSPENFEFVMTDPTGRYVLYYVLASEFIGIFIVWRLMKGVTS
ncbi:pilus assembly protein TadB [Vibrio ponticus]|uniref:Pilus assembly protein TadB n=1 Tax=Vibrio ponticus TaxID=265668 RepID=A0A3N3DTI9_9VIBR|nr:type II secretion system F family protein [Vibrio ponticus]ROV57775.1 pilus assembly protein TadB [Vibrio ponticus]